MSATFEKITQIIDKTDVPHQWSAAVFDPKGSLVYHWRGNQLCRAASHNKLPIALAAKYSGIPFDREVAITKADRRGGNGVLHLFPDNYATTLGTMVAEMLAGDNTAAQLVARTLREDAVTDHTADLINDTVRRRLPIDPHTGLRASDDNPRLFYYGYTTATDSALMTHEALQHPELKAGLERGNMWYGMRRDVDDTQGPPAEIRWATRLAQAGAAVGRILPIRVYDYVLAAQWPVTAYPNKEASDNDRLGNIRGDVMGAPEGFVVSALHATNWLGVDRQPLFGPANPDNLVFAAIGSTVKEYAEAAA